MSRCFTVLFASATTALTLLAIPTLSFAGPQHSPGWQIHHHQQARIYQGVTQGQIGPREYRRLERQQWQITRMRHRFLHIDGHIGSRERARLQHRFDHTNHNIYYARHN